MLHKQASKITLSVLIALFLVVALSACKDKSDTGSTEPGFDEQIEKFETDPVEIQDTPDVGDLSGRWYKNGDTSDEYYELTDSTCNRITADGYEYGESSYSISGASEWLPVGDQIEGMGIAIGDDMFADRGYFSPGFELFTMTELSGGTVFYVHEPVIGTAEGDAAIARYTVVSGDWRSQDEACSFKFYSNDAFEYKTRVDYEDGMYSFETEDSGNWVIEDDLLTISWSNGKEEECDFSGNMFCVPSLDATLFNGKADEGVLWNWYGDYSGEAGEVSISEAKSGNAINVSLYLNDDIGSMYSNSGIELSSDGSSASDEYLALYLDGNTLTVEPIHPEFESYRGSYKRQNAMGQVNDTAVSEETALELVNEELAGRGVDVEALGLELYYDEPESILAALDIADDDELYFVDAWIFLGEDSYFYAVVVDSGQVFKYDMVNGVLMGIDEEMHD